MSATCPNRHRRRRIAHGGGSLECRGTLEVHLSVPVILKVKSMRDPGSVERTLTVRPLKSGVRVPANDVRLAYHATRDIVCASCGWSLKASVAQLNARKRRRVA